MMKLYLLAITILFVAERVGAGPQVCYSCYGSYSYCYTRNQACASDRHSLGTTHCGSAVLKVRSYWSLRYFRGCFNCTDKRQACFVLGGYLRARYGISLVNCGIECCNGSYCNWRLPNLMQNATTVFRPNVAGPRVCQRCFANDTNSCTLKQDNEFCGRNSYFGKTHCGSAKVKAKDDLLGNVTVSIIRGCIDCTDEKAACAIIAGSLKYQRRWTLLECEIECCNSNNCNQGATNLTTCNYCISYNDYSCTRSQTSQHCALNANSLGKTHCASVTFEYRHVNGYGGSFFYRGCMDCADKRRACFALGGYLRVKRGWILLKCSIECCTSNNCNFDVPSLSNAITVFRPNATGPEVCHSCYGSYSACSYYASGNQTCASDRYSLGTTHCGSAAVRVRSYWGSEYVKYFQGCFNCTDKRQACFVLGGYLKAGRFGESLINCSIECCTGNNCNRRLPNLMQNATTVFRPNVAGQRVCQRCFANDTNSCTLKQDDEFCSRGNYFGKTHCGSAKVKAWDNILGNVTVSIIRGCIDCTDEKAACAIIAGSLKYRRQWTLLECEIECCNGSNCNEGATNLTTCNYCIGHNDNYCNSYQTSQLCALHSNSLGKTHCASVAGEYRDRNGYGGSLFYRGCMDCADKRRACFALGGYLRVYRGWILLKCSIECCTNNNCNFDVPSLSNAITVFRPNVNGPRVCQSCLENNADSCTLKQADEFCGRYSYFGKTHCGAARIKTKDDRDGNVTDVTVRFIRGCIDCSDESAACGIIAGSLKYRRRWTVLECEIECCNGSNCNDGAANLTKCNSCSRQGGNNCYGNQKGQICTLDPNSLGTTACASAVGYFRDRRGNEQPGFFRGCMDCAAVSKRDACFTLGGFFKGDVQSPGVSLLRCELECCSGSYCNNQVPRLLPDSVTVFTPTVNGPSTCNVCVENDFTSCSINQEIQVCATNPFSLGTTHCGSAVGKYRDRRGNAVDGFFRGCINCVDKKAACAALGGFRKKLDKWTQLECEIECCTEDNCNTQIPCLG